MSKTVPELCKTGEHVIQTAAQIAVHRFPFAVSDRVRQVTGLPDSLESIAKERVRGQARSRGRLTATAGPSRVTAVVSRNCGGNEAKGLPRNEFRQLPRRVAESPPDR